MTPTQTVNESSAKCAEYNQQNAQLIEAGILLAKQPSPEVLAQEEKKRQAIQAAQAEEQALTVQSALLWEAVIGQLPPKFQDLLKSRSQTGETLQRNIPELERHHLSFTARVEKHTPWGQWSASGPSYYRVEIGHYGYGPHQRGSRRFFKLEGNAGWHNDTKKMKKIADALEEVIGAQLSRAAALDVSAKRSATAAEMLKTHEHTFKRFGITWTNEIKVLDDGRVSCALPFVGTPEQLEQIAELLGK